ncbi:hypothetical protein CTI12_AA249370 [Artemisia annua]|uniref:Uncharacterized protein n=1 Tax=Artemisia annua TaxID=35608 RepID=A0A2U1MBK8_ARTAN|nr:hypothetical protein CTI12_AA249370 [Artemisia annua]
MLEAEEAEINEIEKLKRESEQIEKDMQLKEREQIERERQLKETKVIERETDKDNQTEDETVNEGNASDASMVFTGSDTSSDQQIEDSSPRYDSDADGTHRNEAIWDSADDHIRPSSDTEILATSVKPLLKQKEALEVGYREAVLAKKTFYSTTGSTNGSQQ